MTYNDEASYDSTPPYILYVSAHCSKLFEQLAIIAQRVMIWQQRVIILESVCTLQQLVTSVLLWMSEDKLSFNQCRHPTATCSIIRTGSIIVANVLHQRLHITATCYIISQPTLILLHYMYIYMYIRHIRFFRKHSPFCLLKSRIYMYIYTYEKSAPSKIGSAFCELNMYIYIFDFSGSSTCCQTTDSTIAPHKSTRYG